MEDRKVKVGGRELTLTNLDKVFWPGSRSTKGDLLNYYDQVAKYILPHLKDRPEAMNRFPDGITGEHFFQKNLESHPDWVKTYLDLAGEEQKEVNYVVCNDRATLLYLANLGCIDLNVWSSRIETPESPDFLVFDLDPVEIDFKYVLEAALKLRETLDLIGIESYPKTSGKRGMHIYVPLVPGYTFDQVRDFAHLVVLKIHEVLPKTTSLERQPKDRQGLVYLDYLQNRKGATMAAPYCVRPVAAASVSTPVTWEEVEKGFKPEDFTMKNVPGRLKEIGDIFVPTLKDKIKLEPALEKLKDL